MGGKWRYFTDDEVRGLDNEFVAMLDRARHYSKCPYVIISGLRTPEHNKEVGGVEGSAHTKGLAVDLKCTSPREASLIKKGLYSVGLNRIGNYLRMVDGVPTWAGVHVDYDETKDHDVEWIKIRS